MNPHTDQQQDLDLLQQVLDGEQQAWAEFTRRYQSLIVGCVLRVLRRYSATFTSADLADLVADVWVALLRDDCRKLRLYNEARGYRLTSWIGLITSNCTIDQLRLRQAEHSYFEDMAVPDRFLVERSRPDAQLERREAAVLAREAMSHLSEQEQQFVVSCYRDERPPTELAEELGVTVNTVYSRKFKVRQKLARIVAELNNPYATTELAAAAA